MGVFAERSFGEHPGDRRDLPLLFGLCSFSFAEKKTNQKKPPASRGPSGCPALLAAGGPCGTRLRSNSHRAFFAGCCDARPGTTGHKTPVATRFCYISKSLPSYSKYTSFLKICAPAISKGGTARGWGLCTVIDSAKKKGRQPGHKYSQHLHRRQGRRLNRKPHTRRVWSGLTPHEVQTGCFCWPLASQVNSRRHKRAKRFGRCTAACDAGFTVPPSGRALHLPCALRFHR